MKKYFYLFALVAIFLTSCNNPVAPVSQENLLPLKSGNNWTYKYVYDGKELSNDTYFCSKSDDKYNLTTNGGYIYANPLFYYKDGTLRMFHYSEFEFSKALCTSRNGDKYTYFVLFDESGLVLKSRTYCSITFQENIGIVKWDYLFINYDAQENPTDTTKASYILQDFKLN